MNDRQHPARIQERQFTAEERGEFQLARLNELLSEILPTNRFYAEKFAGLELPLLTVEQLSKLPMTTKSELERAFQNEPHANLTYPFEHYVRVHRTSGTSGAPLLVYDTAEDWHWWKQAWQFVLDAANVRAGDRALMAFSFGPFIGFWSAADALWHRGVQVIPTGGMSTTARLDMTKQCQATLVCCTPTYALRMVEVAKAERFDLANSSVNTLIVAGEPGGSLPEVRRRIESSWGAQVIDHAGATEIGPWGYGDPEGTGLFINESDFIAELLPHQDASVDGAFALHELVLTGLGRKGWPIIRYRTGDLVQPAPSPVTGNAQSPVTGNAQSPVTGNTHQFLAGGILGRADDMLVIRGVNVFPGSIENVIRSFDDVDEFRVTVLRDGEMDQVKIDIECADAGDTARRLATALNRHLGLRIKVSSVAVGSLPRSEAKSKRFIDKRNKR